MLPASGLSPRRHLLRFAAMAVCAIAFIAPVGAIAGSVDDIKRKGVVTVGIQGDNPPWGFVNASGNSDGLDAAVATLFGKYLGVRVAFVPLAVADRIPALTTGRVDVLFATMAMLPERAKAVQYSKPYVANSIVLVAPIKDQLKSIDDMAKFSFGVPASSVQDLLATKLAPINTVIHRYQNDAVTIEALVSGQVTAVGGNSGYIDRMEHEKPGVFENKLVLTSLFNGACSRLGDKQMNETLNTFIDKILASDEYKEIHMKWLRAQIPPMPLSVDGVPFVVK